MQEHATSGPGRDDVADPEASRSHVPGYGIPESQEGLLPWSHVHERLERARIYWVCTAGTDGRPHAIPIWGAWTDQQVFFEGGPRTRWARNLATNPRVAMHLESGEDVVIVEGVAEQIFRPDRALFKPMHSTHANTTTSPATTSEPRRRALSGGWPLVGTATPGPRLDHVPNRHDAFPLCVTPPLSSGTHGCGLVQHPTPPWLRPRGGSTRWRQRRGSVRLGMGVACLSLPRIRHIVTGGMEAGRGHNQWRSMSPSSEAAVPGVDHQST